MRRFAIVFDWFGEIASGLLFAAYALVAVGGLLVGVLAGLGWI